MVVRGRATAVATTAMAKRETEVVAAAAVVKV